jgi:hypothetical protein
LDSYGEIGPAVGEDFQALLNLSRSRIALRAALTLDSVECGGQFNQPASNAQEISIQNQNLRNGRSNVHDFLLKGQKQRLYYSGDGRDNAT